MRTKLSFLLTLIGVLMVQCVFAQTKSISGTVTDDGGIPLPGVSIMVKGTTSGTTTDFDGNYTIEASEGSTLVFTYMGFATVEKAVSLQTTINVQLSPDSQALDEVVITAFGRKMTRNETTANVVTVGGEELEKAPYVDPMQALQGKVSGLNVSTTSGAPGAAPEIQIRGMNSVTASNAPLYVVDGVPINSGNISGSSSATSLDVMALIGSDNIESISVLKDAAAVAPYGADGANGVILITTKSGKLGKPRYSFSYTTGIQNTAVDGLQMINANQKMQIIEESLWNTYGTSLGNGTIANRGDVADFAYNNLGNVKLWEDLGRPSANWDDVVTNDDAMMTDLNFSVSQGKEGSNFYASIGYNNTEGTVIGADFERVNGSFKYSTDLHKKLNLTISANVSSVEQNGALEGGAYFANPNLTRYFGSPWANPYNADGSYNISDSFTALAGGLHNVAYETENNILRNNVVHALQNTTLTYNILDNLVFKTTLGLDYTLSYFKQYQNPNHGDGQTVNGADDEFSNRIFHYTTQNSLDYNFTLGEKHNFRVSAIQSFAKYKFNGLEGYGENFPNGFLNNLSAASANFAAVSTFTDRMKMRYVGLLNYNYDQRYLLSASYSYQGDSRFSEQYDGFYSVGLGWNLHEEDFMKDAGAINTLRLKAGYGVTGNAGIGINEYQALLAFQRYNGNPAAVISGYGTTAQWEKSKRFDASVEFGLFNSRLTGSFGYFNNKTTDMLFNVPLPLSATFTDATVLRNIGEMTNQGFELQVGGDLVVTPDFKWSMNGVFSTLRNRVTKLPENGSIITSVRAVEKGHMVYEWRMKEWAGVDPANGLPLWYINRNESDATTSNYAEAERVYTGYNALPSYSGSISTHFEYKNVFLEGTLYFSGGNKVFEDWASYTQTTDGQSVYSMTTSLAAFQGAWRQPGDMAAYPRFDWSNTAVQQATSASTRFLHDGDYMRLRDIAIGYNFKPETIEALGLTSLSVSVRGSNLWTWVKDDDLQMDPSVSANGITNLMTPPIKTVSFNLNLNF